MRIITDMLRIWTFAELLVLKMRKNNTQELEVRRTSDFEAVKITVICTDSLNLLFCYEKVYQELEVCRTSDFIMRRLHP